jgi:flagellar biosynthesis/type III secretory pathway chaperone
MNARTKAIAKLLKAQKSLCENLAGKAGNLVEAINAEAPMDDLLRIMDEREAIITRLNSGYIEIGETVSKPGNETLSEHPEVVALKAELNSLIKAVMETDEMAARLLTEAFTETQSGLTAMSTGHKTVSTYGKQGKSAFAKYVDRKF